MTEASVLLEAAEADARGDIKAAINAIAGGRWQPKLHHLANRVKNAVQASKLEGVLDAGECHQPIFKVWQVLLLSSSSCFQSEAKLML